MRAKVIISFLMVLLIVVSGYWLYNHYYLKGDSALQASGTIEASSVTLNARINGTIKEFLAAEGDLVNQDQLIVQLSRSDLNAQRERDAHTVTAAEARLNDLQAGARSEEIEETLANVNTARINLEKTESDLNRAEALFASQAISEKEIEGYRLQKETAENQLAAAEARLNLLQSGSRAEVINAATAELQKSKAILKATDSLIEDLKIHSPISGVLTSKNYEPGEYVVTGASLGTVTDLSDMWIKVYIPTDDLPWVKLGQTVNITVSGSEEVFSGEVSFIASQGEFTPKTVQTKKERTNIVYGVKISIDNKNGILKPGMPADVTFVDGSDIDVKK